MSDHQLADIALCATTMRAAIYAASTDPVDAATQVRAAREEIASIGSWTLDRRHIYVDHGASAPLMSLHTWETALAAAEGGAFALVVVRDPTCLARDRMQKLAEAGIRLWTYVEHATIDVQGDEEQ